MDHDIEAALADAEYEVKCLKLRNEQLHRRIEVLERQLRAHALPIEAFT